MYLHLNFILKNIGAICSLSPFQRMNCIVRLLTDDTMFYAHSDRNAAVGSLR